MALADSFFNAKVPAVYVNLPGGYRHVVLDGATQLPKFYPETGDYITEYVGRNAIITHDGFTLGKPLTLRDSIDGNDYTIQHFIRQKDGSLLCTDDNRITITADALNKVVGDERLLWRVNAADCKGELGTAFAGLNTGFKAYNGSSLVHFNIGLNVLNNTKSPYTMVVRIKTKRGSYLNMSVPYTVEYIGKDEIKFVLGEMDSNMKTFIDKVPAFKTMMNKLASSTFKCSSNSLIAPVNMVLTDSSDASSALGISIQ